MPMDIGLLVDANEYWALWVPMNIGLLDGRSRDLETQDLPIPLFLLNSMLADAWQILLEQLESMEMACP
ncbi:hypothetical protein A2U01_0026561 [Trifolium medium]|uniref:Uncharacterized protein n=1 Tax=Trifolium medium TaxID=97028 RepID=A0A392P0G5_9FABA|nr:hypothetical protein [Trifolium medium]